MSREGLTSRFLRRLVSTWRWRGQTRLRQLATLVCLRSEETFAPIGKLTFPFLRRHWPFYFGLYEQNNIAFLRRWLARGDVFFDVGANVGYFTAVASDLVDQTGCVHAFEPEPGHYARLMQLKALNPTYDITTNPAAMTDHDGEVELFLSHHAGWHSIRADFNEETRLGSTFVSAVKMDSYCRKVGLDHKGALRLVKIDVEGAEWEVIKGAASAIEYHWAEALLIETSSGPHFAQIYEFLTESGFSPLTIASDGSTHPISVPGIRQMDVLWIN